MLTKYKDVRRKKGVNKPFKKMFLCLRRIQKLFQGGSTPNFDVVSSVFFSGRIMLKYIENKKDLRGSGGVLPGNFLKIYVL